MDATTITAFYQNLPVLETQRLVLRPATAGDVPDIFSYASDRDVTRYLRWEPHQALADTERYVSDVLAEYREGSDGPWAIEYKPTHRVIGHIHLMDVEARHRKAQVGFVLAKSYWNQGIATEALGRVLTCLFGTLGLNRVEAWCISENRAAARVLEKAGMRKEGELRQYCFQKGVFWDFCVHAILHSEFRM